MLTDIHLFSFWPFLLICGAFFAAICAVAILIYVLYAANRRLKDTEVRLQTIVENALDGLITLNEEGVIESFSAVCAEIFGYEAQEVIGKNVSILMPEPYRSNHDSYLRRYRETGQAKVLGAPRLLEGRRKDGQVFPLKLSANVAVLPDRRLFVGVVRDVTEHRRIEQQLMQARKMEAIGQLTGGVAHDFNNILTIIFGNTRLLVRELEAESSCLNRVENIQMAAERGADLIKRMMVFSRQRDLVPETVQVNALISDMRDLLQRSLGEMVEIRMSLADDVWSVDIDPGMLEHILINMSVNARDAMPDGGVLFIETRNVFIEDGAFIPDGDLASGSYVRLSISDTGAGIPDDIRPKIFDPFFTTKEVGKGTGLGLSMVYGFVKESGGAVHVYSEAGRGAIFHIYFPRSGAEEVAVVRQDPEQEDLYAGSETLMVVEDEADIRLLTVDLLRKHGYTVIEAGNGLEALEILMEEECDVQMLFTDIAMPGDMNGVQLAGRAQALKPGLKLLFTSGYAGGTLPDLDLAQKYPFLGKPYQPLVLMRTIRDILDRPQVA